MRIVLLLFIFPLSLFAQESRYKVGEYYKELGGIVFYTDPNGINGLVCAPSDQGDFLWGCIGTEIYGCDATGIYGGIENLKDITAGCNDSIYAAKVCKNLTLNGFSDWYLPSIEELELIYNVLFKKGIGDFAKARYWSSTEESEWLAHFFYFIEVKYQYPGAKDESYRVRAIRKF